MFLVRPHRALRGQGILFYGESVYLRPNKMARYHGIVGDLKYSTFLGHKHLYRDIQKCVYTDEPMTMQSNGYHGLLLERQSPSSYD